MQCTEKRNRSSKQIELDLLRTFPSNRYFQSLDSPGMICFFNYRLKLTARCSCPSNEACLDSVQLAQPQRWLLPGRVVTLLRWC